MKQILLSILLLFSSATIALGQEQENMTSNDSLEVKLSMVDKVTAWYADNMNYYSITALMALESSFIPFPSEVVIPPAVYVAEEDTSDLRVADSYLINVLLIVLFGTIGAIIGAIINYLLSIWLGRPIIYKFADSRVGKVLLLSSEKIRHAEDYFNQHGKVSTFIGRLIPGIRQLISIPAGLARMPFLPFILYTFLGAFMWNCVLALIGYVAHGQRDLINEYSHILSDIILILLAAIVVGFLIKWAIKKYRSQRSTV